MARNYTIRTKILRPVADVFDAVVSRDKLCEYFTSQASGDFEQGAKIWWRWRDYDVELPVVVDKVRPNELIELTLDSKAWKKTKGESYPVKVIFEFEALEDGITMLSISEEGWKTDADGLKQWDCCSAYARLQAQLSLRRGNRGR